MGRLRAPRAALVCTLASLPAVALGACDEAEIASPPNSAIGAAELARYLPEGSKLVQTVDVTRVREELELPNDADAAPLTDDVLRDGQSPQARLVTVTGEAYPVLRDAFNATFGDAKGASPLDGTLIRAAAQSEDSAVSIVLTAEPFPEIAEKLERFGYSRELGIYLAGETTKNWAPPVVADGGEGRVIFADEERFAAEVLHRIARDSEAGLAAEAIQAVSGSVRMGSTYHGRRCVEAVAAGQSATGRGAILALQIKGHKPEPERFDPKKLKSLDTGTVSVLVDSLLVPFNIAKPDEKPAGEPVSAVFYLEGVSETSQPGGDQPRFTQTVPTPADAYDCP